MRRGLRAMAVLGAVLGGAVTLCLSMLVLVGYLRAPRLMATLEQPSTVDVDPATLPPARICALLAVQDRTFFRHHGLGLPDGPPLHTTLTQSLCKGLYFRRFSPGTLRYRKIALMAFAVGFDLRVPKQAQLRAFLNHAYLGNADGVEVLGFPSAARAYFRRDLAAITDEEFLSLVNMLVAPSTYHVILQPEASSRRRRDIEPWIKAACSKECLERPPYAPCATLAP